MSRYYQSRTSVAAVARENPRSRGSGIEGQPRSWAVVGGHVSYHDQWLGTLGEKQNVPSSRFLELAALLGTGR